MRRTALLVLASSSALLACSPAKSPELSPVPPVTSARVGVLEPAPIRENKGGGYAGHGSESVSPEIIRQFAPGALQPALARRIQSMLDVRAPNAGQVTPDGKQLYFTWTITGTSQVFRLDGPNKFPSQVTGGQDPTMLGAIAPNGKFVVVSRDRNGEENPGLYLMDPATSTLTEIQHKSKVQTELEFVSADSAYVYFRANDVKPASYAIYRYDVAKKTRETVFDQDGIWNVADHRENGKLLLAKEVGGNQQEFYEWDAAKKTLTPLFGQGEKEDYEARYSAKEGAKEGDILVITPKFSEFRKLYTFKKPAAGKATDAGVVDLKANTKKDPKSESQAAELNGFFAVAGDAKGDVGFGAFDAKKKTLFLHINEAGYTRLDARDGTTLKPVALPNLPKGDHVRTVGASQDGRFVTLAVDTGKGPVTSYVLDTSSKATTQWHKPSVPEVDAKLFQAPKLESYPARDGTKIPLFVWQSEACEKASTPCPVIVSFHGGPEAQTVAGFYTTAQIFLQSGFTYIAPNVRGSEGYGRTWVHADDGPKRLQIITDIEDAGKYAREKYSKAGKAPKVGIMGGSYGGYSTLAGVSMFPDTFDAGASIVGISNLVTFLENTAPYRRILRISEYGDPQKDREALVMLSPITHVNKIKVPLLIVQGATDPRVPVGEALQMYNAVNAKGVPTKLVIFADEGHGSAKRENKVLEIGHVVSWFETYLKSGNSAPQAASSPTATP